MSVTSSLSLQVPCLSLKSLPWMKQAQYCLSHGALVGIKEVAGTPQMAPFIAAHKSAAL